MIAIPLSRFFKTNWLNSHCNQCFKLTRNYYETIITRDSIAAGLTCYQNLWAKFLQPLRALNCGIGSDKVQHGLWRSHNLPVVKIIKKVVVLCGTNNLKHLRHCYWNGRVPRAKPSRCSAGFRDPTLLRDCR